MTKKPGTDLRQTPAVKPVAECAAVLRMLEPLSVSRESSVDRQRRLLADVFRMIGNRLVQPPGNEAAVPPPLPAVDSTARPRADVARNTSAALSPRLGQTLDCLLAGQSEKQAAHQLGLSPHTVHVYVKTLYRRFGVTSRAELLARHVQR